MDTLVQLGGQAANTRHFKGKCWWLYQASDQHSSADLAWDACFRVRWTGSVDAHQLKKLWHLGCFYHLQPDTWT